MKTPTKLPGTFFIIERKQRKERVKMPLQKGRTRNKKPAYFFVYYKKTGVSAGFGKPPFYQPLLFR